MNTPSAFPDHFLFGAATAAFQIEGAAREDGKGLSIWDVFCTRQGKIEGGHTGDVACDHYHRWREDVALMREIGLQAYRFSIAWPRVLPAGRGAVNAPGLAFYDRLVDVLLEAGVTPLVTLYHWDLPHALQCEGGWLNRATAEAFGDYAALVARTLGDRVSRWCTINEIANPADLGHIRGVHAPGLTYSPGDYFRVAHHLNLAHGRGLAALRAHCRLRPEIGQAFNLNCVLPADASPAAVESARAATFGFNPASPWTSAHLWTEPACTGRYSDEVQRFFAPAYASVVHDGDLAAIGAPMDYLGWNHYMDWTKPHRAAGEPLTHLKWSLHPEGLYWGSKFLAERYRLPIHILENGLACMDWVDLDGEVQDPQRIDYIRRHLREIRRALAEGIDIRSYFYWSLIDNLEWAEGFMPRFGLVHVDYPTQKRTLKRSAHWYRDLIRSRGAIA